VSVAESIASEADNDSGDEHRQLACALHEYYGKSERPHLWQITDALEENFAPKAA